MKSDTAFLRSRTARIAWALLALCPAAGAAAAESTGGTTDQQTELNASLTGGTVRILLAQEWGVDGGGSWETSTNWIGPVPDGAGHVANFLMQLATPTNAPATITLDGDRTVGTLRFNNTVTNGNVASSYVIAQGTGGTLRIVGGGGTPPSIEVLAGTHTIAAPLELTTSTINIAGGGMLRLTNDVSLSPTAASTVTKTGQGTLHVSTPLDLTGHALRVSQGTFSIAAHLNRGDVTVEPGATLLAGAINPHTLTIRGSANVDRIADDGSDAAFTIVRVQGPEAVNPASLRSAGIRADELSIGHGKLTIKPGGGELDTTVVSSLAMTEADSTLDLSNNDLIVHAGAGGPTMYAAMRMLVQQARNSELGRWQGPGITSSAAAGDSLSGLALVLNSTIVDGAAQPIFKEVSGEPTVLNDVIVKYTYNGDANLDGRINADDYFRIDSGFLAGGGAGGWHNGDFNYDGKVDADDYFLIDSAFLGQGQPLDGISGPLKAVSVPEPACFMLTLAPLLLLPRRRR